MKLSGEESSFGSGASSPCSPPPFPSLPCLAPHLFCPLFFKVPPPTSPPARPATHPCLNVFRAYPPHILGGWLLWVLKNCLGRRVAHCEVGVGTSGAEAREADGLSLPPCVGATALALGQAAYIGVIVGGPELGLRGAHTPSPYPIMVSSGGNIPRGMSRAPGSL